MSTEETRIRKAFKQRQLLRLFVSFIPLASFAIFTNFPDLARHIPLAIRVIGPVMLGVCAYYLLWRCPACQVSFGFTVPTKICPACKTQLAD